MAEFQRRLSAYRRALDQVTSVDVDGAKQFGGQQATKYNTAHTHSRRHKLLDQSVDMLASRSTTVGGFQQNHATEKNVAWKWRNATESSANVASRCVIVAWRCKPRISSTAVTYVNLKGRDLHFLRPRATRSSRGRSSTNNRFHFRYERRFISHSNTTVCTVSGWCHHEPWKTIFGKSCPHIDCFTPHLLACSESGVRR